MNYSVQEVTEKMYAYDYGTRSLGMKIEKVDIGYAQLSMLITKEMLNGLGTCHGGMVFSLADSAFAFASNAANEASVALDCTITFAKASFEGDVLTAKAQQLTNTKKTGLYDVQVTNQKGETVAFFRGTVFKVGKMVTDLCK